MVKKFGFLILNYQEIEFIIVVTIFQSKIINCATIYW